MRSPIEMNRDLDALLERMEKIERKVSEGLQEVARRLHVIRAMNGRTLHPNERIPIRIPPIPPCLRRLRENRPADG